MGNDNGVCSCKSNIKRDEKELIKAASRKRQNRIDRSIVKWHVIGAQRNQMQNTSKLYLPMTYSAEIVNSDNDINKSVSILAISSSLVEKDKTDGSESSQ